jgi:UDP-N-acetylglucosamine diphosphorylase/glucosamine-1-phosphate N-acetyltransferase
MSKPTFILNDHYENWINLQPLTITKPVSALRIGITSIAEKWSDYLQCEILIKTCTPYLKSKDTWRPELGGEQFFINSSILPNDNLVKTILKLANGQSLYHQGTLIASRINPEAEQFEEEVAYEKEILQLKFPWDIFNMNQEALALDFKKLTTNKNSATLSQTNTLIGPKDQLFIEAGAKIEASILNTSHGPIYIGKDAEIMEGSIIRGGLALCQGAVLKLGTKIYGSTTIGPFSKVGGEVNNSVIQGYSNKGHDGFLGNSVIGEWCNLGADTNNSNLKNNYGEVSIYNYNEKAYIRSGLQFLGLIMGDHSKCGINTMFNTGTVVGVFANIFGGNFPPKFIPSFSWGGSDGFTRYNFDKAIEVAERVMERRKEVLNPEDEAILKFVYDKSIQE